jgi:hypothetical protein
MSMRVPSMAFMSAISPEILERHIALQNRDMIPLASFDVKTSLMTRIIGLVVSPQIVMKLQLPNGVPWLYPKAQLP